MSNFLKSSRQKRRVLVVDDELINRELLETILSFDYDVTTVSSGIEAMNLLRAEPESFSLLLLDIIMPRMSGFEVIEACKSDDKLKNIPIIVMTSEKSAEVRSIHMGAADFIAKPYRMPEVIIARCERIIEQNEEQKLIRSIEKDAVTGLYVKLFFDAYVKRLAPGLRPAMDAIAVKVDGIDLNSSQAERDAALKKTAGLLMQNVIGKKGIACRAGDDLLLGYCRHKENYEELIGKIVQEMSDDPQTEFIRLRVGICERVDTEVDIKLWYDKAVDCCSRISGNDGNMTATCTLS